MDPRLKAQCIEWYVETTSVPPSSVPSEINGKIGAETSLA